MAAVVDVDFSGDAVLASGARPASGAAGGEPAPGVSARVLRGRRVRCVRRVAALRLAVVDLDRVIGLAEGGTLGARLTQKMLVAGGRLAPIRGSSMTATGKNGSSGDRWAIFRFSVVAPLLASPPRRGELRAALAELAARDWKHPITGAPLSLGASTIERWYYVTREESKDPVGRLRRRVRKDAGRSSAMTEALRAAVLAQYEAHKSWSYQLHYDNLAALLTADAKLGVLPSYATIRRFMKSRGLVKMKRRLPAQRRSDERAARHREEREVRSYEAEYVHGLWHLDFHPGSRTIATSSGERSKPSLLCILDDRSRLACHAQWYLDETAEDLVHGLTQAIQKRGLPRQLMSDNGSAMKADEFTQGLSRVGIRHEPTLDYAPYQNGKQESFWGQVEGRLLAMMENVEEITLPMLNEATQAWLHLEYNQAVHSETRQTPTERMLAGPSVGRPSPTTEELRLAFMVESTRSQRRSDGTISVEGVRFEIPNRYRHVERVTVRYARWDLSQAALVDARTRAILCRVYPLDRARNADGLRRKLSPPTEATVKRPGEMAPLLKQLMNEYAATGLPPGYLPKRDVDRG